MANLRHWGAVFQMYAADNDGKFYEFGIMPGEADDFSNCPDPENVEDWPKWLRKAKSYD